MKYNYNTLREVLEAQKSGELKFPLEVELDNSFIYNNKGQILYKGPGHCDIFEEALDLLGVNWILS